VGCWGRGGEKFCIGVEGIAAIQSL
jgi:hypothetical protein